MPGGRTGVLFIYHDFAVLLYANALEGFVLGRSTFKCVAKTRYTCASRVAAARRPGSCNSLAHPVLPSLFCTRDADTLRRVEKLRGRRQFSWEGA